MNGTLNKVILIGLLGDNIKVTRFEGGAIGGRVSLATDESYKDKQGNKVEAVEWHNLEFWGKSAEIMEKYTAKGDKIQIEGKLKTKSFKREGDTKNSFFTSIKVDSFNFLGKSQKSAEQKPTQTSTVTQNEEPDDLPF